MHRGASLQPSSGHPTSSLTCLAVRGCWGLLPTSLRQCCAPGPSGLSHAYHGLPSDVCCGYIESEGFRVYNPARAALPTLDIAEGALDKIFALYKELLPGLGGYLTHAGQLHAGRLEALLARLALLEQETLEQRAAVRAFA